MARSSSQSSASAYSPEEFGDLLLEWQIDSFPHHQRSKRWYAIMASVGVLLVLYAIFTSNFLFAVLILMMAVVMLLTSFTQPKRLDVVITSTGVIVGDMYYDYLSIKNFSLVYDPPEVKNLYLDFHSITHPLLSVPLEDTDPNRVREALLPFCLENLNRTEETLTDVLQRLYKL